eukprot:1148734-Pelagomonas_calceolata.AAC.1
MSPSTASFAAHPGSVQVVPSPPSCTRMLVTTALMVAVASMGSGTPFSLCQGWRGNREGATMSTSCEHRRMR